MSLPDPFFDWYHTPLSLEDCLAGGAMILLCVIFIPLTVLVSVVMWKADKEIIGYRYLISASFADINCMLQYGFLNGIAILTKNPLTLSEDGRSAMQIYIDIIWFSLCLHYPLVAWSRFAAIKTPIWFRSQQRWHSYLICLGVYLVAVIMVVTTHWSPWFVRFYYEPAVYGLLAEDFVKYLVQGMSSMFLYLHIFCVVVPLILYLWTIVLILRDRHVAAGAKSRGQMSVEKRLMVPCIIGNVIFVIGQVAITIGTGTGKWATWTICLIFVINSAANCVMLLLFSPSLRMGMFKCRFRTSVLRLGGKSPNVFSPSATVSSVQESRRR